jgi:hypothetical protein
MMQILRVLKLWAREAEPTSTEVGLYFKLRLLVRSSGCHKGPDTMTFAAGAAFVTPRAKIFSGVSSVLSPGARAVEDRIYGTVLFPFTI